MSTHQYAAYSLRSGRAAESGAGNATGSSIAGDEGASATTNLLLRSSRSAVGRNLLDCLAVRLVDGDGHGLELSVTGYQFPDAADPGERFSWHMVDGAGYAPYRSLAVPVSGADLRRDAAWLRAVAVDGGQPGLAFTEPNLAFQVAGRFSGQVTLNIELDLEFSVAYTTLLDATSCVSSTIDRSSSPAPTNNGARRSHKGQAKLVRVLKATLKGPRRSSQRPSNPRPQTNHRATASAGTHPIFSPERAAHQGVR